ncbi:jerky protein homolog-like [Colletes gigas]|uniref:jerky protein homolog-like n=1 Tax=Colletes gigas TaxID=935657 RepID=UPI001C9A8444|nr:jerky protein homolog-like [Colletes gigas]
MATGKRNNKSVFSIQQRYEIVQQLKNGASARRLAAKYDVHPTTIRRIRQNAAAVYQFAKEGVAMRTRKNTRKPANEELDNRMYMWYLERKAIGKPITNLLLLEKAIEFNKECGGPSKPIFKASKGWLWKFKNRHGIRLINDPNKKKDTTTAEQFVNDFARRIEQEEIEYRNIYNMDVTALLWKALPTKISTNNGERNMEGTTCEEDRATVGLCVNATGSHKLPLLFIHKIKNPKELKHCKDSLPVIYKAQSQAWIDQEIFSDWYQNHFIPAVKTHQTETGTSGKVILLLNNCRHKLQLAEKFQQDDQFHIMLLPHNTTPFLQPMNQGIIENVKKSFRHKMLHRVLSFPGGAREFYLDYDLKDCIDLLYDAWTETSATSIRNAWKNIIKRIPEESTIKEEPGDPLEPNLQEIIGVITGEQACEQSVNEFLSKCTEAENNMAEDESSLPRSDTLPNEEDMKKAFKNLTKWSEQEPDFIRLHVQYLKGYYEQKQCL